MAIVRHLELQNLHNEARHTETEGTYSLVEQSDGKYLQIDTYGSSERKMAGKKSQSIRLSREALAELRDIIGRHFHL